MLVRHNHPNIKDIKYYLLVTDKDKYAPSAVFYEVSETMMDKQDQWIMDSLESLGKCLSGEAPWEDSKPSFKGAQELQLINEEYNDII
jgi:hypothetical protein